MFAETEVTIVIPVFATGTQRIRLREHPRFTRLTNPCEAPSFTPQTIRTPAVHAVTREYVASTRPTKAIDRGKLVLGGGAHGGRES